MSCVLSTVGLIALIINSLVVVRYGRRRILLMAGLTTCAILQLIIAVTYDKKPGAQTTGKVLVALSCLYMMSYNVGASISDDEESNTDKFSGNGRPVCMAHWRRDTISASSKLRFRPRNRDRIFDGLAHPVHSSVLHQSVSSELGS